MNKSVRWTRKYMLSLMRVFFLLILSLFLPRLFLAPSHDASSLALSTDQFRLGIENVTESFLKKLSIHADASYSAALITSHYGIDQGGSRTIDILRQKGLQIKKIFIPEDDLPLFNQENNHDLVDQATGIPLVTVANVGNQKSLAQGCLDDVDVLFFDMQDTDSNVKTNIMLLARMLKEAQRHHKKVVVLDRPNMLGSAMEGVIADLPLSAQEWLSIPMRHGMTIGELARYFNDVLLQQALDLHVIPMSNYNRAHFAQNMMVNNGNVSTNIDAYYGSSFLSMLSAVAPFDVGIGTEMAFSCLALPESLHFPKQKWFELRTILKDEFVGTTWCRYRHPKKHTMYAGLRCVIRNIEEFSPFHTLLTIVQFFKDAGMALTFSTELDRMGGSKKMREFFEGKCTKYELEHAINKELKTFFTRAHTAFLYKPVPKVVLL